MIRSVSALPAWQEPGADIYGRGAEEAEGEEEVTNLYIGLMHY